MCKNVFTEKYFFYSQWKQCWKLLGKVLLYFKMWLTSGYLFYFKKANFESYLSFQLNDTATVFFGGNSDKNIIYIFSWITMTYQVQTTRCQFHQHSIGSIWWVDIPKAQKTDNLTVFFVLSGSACVKAAHRMLMKLTPDFWNLDTWAHVHLLRRPMVK